MHFIGLVGLIDPPREEAKQAILECKTAGIGPVMITGDHPLTAASIARQLGIIDSEDQKVVTGIELAKNKAENLETDVEKIRVHISAVLPVKIYLINFRILS